jgi:C4-dicarboxylate transporter DctM subunit
MSPELVGLFGIIVLVILLFSGMWISLAMAIVGFGGCVYLSSIGKAFITLGTVPYVNIAIYPISCVPLFILMGVVVANTGVSGDLYNTAYKWIGQLRGGLAMASVVACGAFAAISGSSSAGAATMGKVALPEMKRYRYDPKLATGCIAAGGTVGILIPPSLGFILYGILTEQSVGHLFMAGIIPGVLEVVFYVATIYILCQFNPRMGPPGPKTSFKDKIVSLKNTWHMVILFLLVLGGIYAGIFTPTEAGAVGAFGAIVITAASRRLTLRNSLDSALEAGLTTAMVLFLLIGAYVFMRFLALSKLPFLLAESIGQLPASPIVILLFVIIFYIIIGMFLDIFSSIILTIPIIYPMIIALGFDPIWYGVIMVRVMEVGLITPPVGLNVFVLAGVADDVPLGAIFRGVLPFVVADILHIALLVAVPALSLFIPSRM